MCCRCLYVYMRLQAIVMCILSLHDFAIVHYVFCENFTTFIRFVTGLIHAITHLHASYEIVILFSMVLNQLCRVEILESRRVKLLQTNTIRSL